MNEYKILLSKKYYRECVEIIGRLCNLQRSVTTTQIKRRMFENFGQRNYIVQIVSKTLKVLVENRLLKRVQHGLYEPVTTKISAVEGIELMKEIWVFVIYCLF